MPIANSGNLKISYDDLGNGKNALLIMTGWCDNRVQFSPLANLLAREHRVLTMDWRGHGASDKPGGDFGLAELVADAEAVIAAAGVESVVPVAESHAGWVAIELRKRLGARVSRLVLLDWIVRILPPNFLVRCRRFKASTGPK
jgi:pimeloyl-ACP methyl ester carboxylesterase